MIENLFTDVEIQFSKQVSKKEDLMKYIQYQKIELIYIYEL